MRLGFDPVWFGILIVCVVEIGMITPPVGMNVFVLSSVLPDVPTGQIWRGVMPFIVADIVRLAILIAFPAIDAVPAAAAEAVEAGAVAVLVACPTAARRGVAGLAAAWPNLLTSSCAGT